MLALSLLLALTSGVQAEKLPIKTYTIADGLAHDQVDKIVQDSHGFLWFCTMDGLSRFDGYRFTNYGVKDGLPFARINDFMESRRTGVYWVATNNGGVSRFDPTAEARQTTSETQAAGDAGQAKHTIFTTYQIGEEPQDNSVAVLYEDRAGNIWAGTQGGLFRLDATGNEGKFERVALGIPARADRVVEVECLVEDAEGSLWMGTNIGIVRRLPDGRTIHYPVQTSQGTDYVFALMLDTDGRLWCGHQVGLLVLMPTPAAQIGEDDTASFRQAQVASQAGSAKTPGNRLNLPASPGQARWYTTAEGLANNNVQALHQYADGRIWIGTRGGGVSVFDGERFRNYRAEQGLSNRINTLAEDRDGNVWVGTQTSGAMKIAGGGFVSYAEGEGLGNLDVISIFETLGGELCVISGKWTVNWFDGEKFSSARLNLPRRIIDSSSSRWTIIQDHTGEWWAATGEGLYRFPRVEHLDELAHAPPLAVYTTQDGLADNNISRLFEDTRGDIWISSYNPPVMLTRWERATGNIQRYAEADGLPGFNWTNVFGEDREGNLWIALHNGGLARRRNGRFELFRAAEKVPEGLGQGLYLDHAGRLWVATSGKGVRLEEPAADDPRIAALPNAGELSSDNLRCFTEDQWGRIYIGTARGVDRLDPSTGRIKHFTTADGLIKSEVMAAFSDRNGVIWLGTREGLSRLIPEPDRLQSPPPVLISGLRIAGVPQPISELGQSEVAELTLESGQGQIQIDFFGLSFSAGEELRYQYKFEGANRDWSAPTDQRTITASLSPGKYRFIVRAISSDGTLSPAPATVSFRILPPVWQRWWFVVLASLAVGASIYVIDRYRLARAVELERVRTRIATDLHDDIGASLSQIAILSEVVTQRVGQEDARGVEALSMIAGTSREMVDSMSDIVWAINPTKDHLSDLSQRMRRFASDILSARDIEFRFRAPTAEKDIRLGTDLRREIYLIFKESINNMVKHSACTEADLEFRIVHNWLVVRVSDNGRGFDMGAAGNGNSTGMGGHGLVSMRRRAEALGGTYEVKSAKAGGTTVTLKVPVQTRRLKFWRKTS